MYNTNNDKKFLSDIALDIHTVLEDIRVMEEEGVLTKENIKTLIAFYNIKFDILADKLMEVDRNPHDVIFNTLVEKINKELSSPLQQDDIFLLNFGRRFGHTTSMCELLNVFKRRDDVDIKAFVPNSNSVKDVKRTFLHDVQSVSSVHPHFMRGNKTKKDTILVFDQYSYLDTETVDLIVREYRISVTNNKKIIVVGVG